LRPLKIYSPPGLLSWTAAAGRGNRSETGLAHRRFTRA